MRIYFSIVLCFFINVHAFAQNKKSFIVGAGLNYQNSKDKQHQSIARSSLGSALTFGFIRYKEKVNHKINLRLSYNKQSKKSISFSHYFHSTLSYSYLRKINGIKGLYIGGYADAGAIISLKDGVWSGNNYVSYTFWSSIGPEFLFKKAIQIAKREYHWKTRFSIPLVSYFIRPSYAFPYPANYLKNGTFHFDHSGIGKSIITNGRLGTINYFSNIKFQTGIYLSIKEDKHEIGIVYSFYYTHTKELKPIYHQNHSLSFIIEI